MKMREMLDTRDEAIKVRLLSVLPQSNEQFIVEAGKMLDEAFEKGAKDWEEEYIKAYFPDRAEQVRNKFRDETV